MQKKLTLVSVVIFLSATAFAQRQMTISEYVELYAPIAVSEMMHSNIPASITLAQGILESGVGGSWLTVTGNNHFGIKCHENWEGEALFYDDDAENECFRKYNSPEESFIDHSEFLLKRGRYADLFLLEKTDYRGWAKGLKAAGYATNPVYAEKLISLIENNQLHQFDLVTDYQIWLAEFQGDQPEIHEQMEDEPEMMLASEAVFYINRIKTIEAQAGMIPLQVALQFDISLKRLLEYNDMYEGDLFNTGQNVFLQPKRNNGDAKFHTVEEGETMYSISQNHGVKLDRLYEKNLMIAGSEPKVAETIFLQKKRVTVPEIVEPELSPVVKSSAIFEANNNETLESITLTVKKSDVTSSSEFDPSQTDNSYQYHLVKKGDTLYSISRNYDIAIDKIKEVNQLGSDGIQTGQILKVPAE